MNLPSELMENAVREFAKLPGIGRKTALRLVLHLIQSDLSASEHFGNAIIDMRKKIKFCQKCNNISDGDLCSICVNKSRNHELICVVESVRELLIIENTGHYNGLYHILGGLISPIDGINPEDLHINSLIKRVESEETKELIMALNSTMEGDTTVFYLSRKLKNLPVKITTIARGVSFGGELEYADEVTLARSIESRRPFEFYMHQNQSEDN
ncbi:MAG: recombination protein RecR [Chitinophagaceae bacterium]|nr:MAG: recombination protein RecR [Chitinophagaceae bacterium]